MKSLAWKWIGPAIVLAVSSIGAASDLRAESPAPPFSPDQFEPLFEMVNPQMGEVRFWDILWFLSVYDARARAAAEGKPILVWSGYGGAPLAVC